MPVPVSRSAPPPSVRNVLLLVATCFAVRIAFLASASGDPVFDLPMLDAEYAVDWARQILAQGPWVSPEGSAYFRTPLYAWLLAALFALPGPDLLLARIFQAALGAVAAGWLAGIAGRRFGRVAFWTTGALAGLAWPLLFFGRELLIVTLAFFLCTAFLRLLDGASPASGIGRWFAAGLLVGLGTIARANLLALALPAAWLAMATGGAAPWRRGLAVVLGILVCVAPVAVRNRVVSGEWIALSSQGGINLWIGNHPGADGMSAQLPGFSFWRNEDVEAALTLERGRPLSPKEQDAHFRGLALGFFRDHPGQAATLLARKTYLFLQGYEIRNNRDLYDTRARDPILSLPLPDFGWVLPLALLGFVTQWRRRRELSFLWITALVTAAGIVAFFVCSRYRLPAWPALLVYAGAGIGALADRAAPVRRRAARAAVLVAAIALTRIDFLGIRHPDPSQSHYQVANSYARAGDDAAAEREFREALRLDPHLAEARHHLGALLLREGRIDEAIPELRAAADALPRSFRARRSLAEALEAAGDLPGALAVRRETARLSAGALADRIALATTLGMNGRTDEALALFRGIADDGGADDPAFLLNAGQTALERGDREAGLRWLRAALSHGETGGAARLALARYHLAAGEPDEARRLLEDAPPELAVAPALLRLRAIARYTTGDAEGAARDLEAVLAADPADGESRARLAALRREAGP
jgi:thioredoxin-like negative regulator of GroEL/4-amino-4-deoxy-L-arabinose transferase-like glycosyltransferase